MKISRFFRPTGLIRLASLDLTEVTYAVDASYFIGHPTGQRF